MKALVYLGPNSVTYRDEPAPVPEAGRFWSRSRRSAFVAQICMPITAMTAAARPRSFSAMKPQGGLLAARETANA